MRMKLILPLLFLGLIFFPLALAEQTEQTTVECELVPGANLPPVTGSDIPLRQVTYTDYHRFTEIRSRSWSTNQSPLDR